MWKMKVWNRGASVGVGLVVIAAVADAQNFQDLPSCAVPCFVDDIPKTGCSLTDTACQCASETQAKWPLQVIDCLTINCSVGDLLSTFQVPNQVFQVSSRPPGAEDELR